MEPGATGVPSAPPGVAELFGPRWPQVQAYVAALAGAGVERGLLGPREAARIWDRHVLNCAGIAALIPPQAVVGDLGSGAGLPGIVVALLRDDLRIDLIEPLLRRVTFLQEMVAELGLERVRVVRGRAEVLPAGTYDVVTARAVAPLSRLVGWSARLLRPGGELIAIKGESAAQELAESKTSIERTGAVRTEVTTVSALGETTWVVRVVMNGPPRGRDE